MSKYRVLTSISLGYDSDVRDPNAKRFKTFKKGDILKHDSDAPNGNVWFFDSSGERGKIECGSVMNRVKSGDLEKV
jgi:hypothetical protein